MTAFFPCLSENVCVAENVTERPQTEAWKSRACVWGAIFVASRLPEIICRELGFNADVWVSPFWETVVLLGLAILAAKVCPTNQNLPGFIVATIALTFSWRVVVPWIESSPFFVSFVNHASWGARFFLLRAIRVVGVIFLIGTLMGSGIGRRELFLQFGNWRSPVQAEPFFPLPVMMPWGRFAVRLLLIFAILLPVYLYLTVDIHIERIYRVLFILPWALATSALNAASEEFQFRSVPLARLADVVPMREAYLAVAVLFGVSHYFGQPSGWGGVFMAGFAGWIWSKSMIETQGFGWAFATHFVQDLVIFCVLAFSNTDLSALWS